MLLEDIYTAIGPYYTLQTIIFFGTNVRFTEERFPWFKTAPTGWKVSYYSQIYATLPNNVISFIRHYRTLSAIIYLSIPLFKKCPGLSQTEGRAPTGPLMITLIHGPIVPARNRLAGLLSTVCISLSRVFQGRTNVDGVLSQVRFPLAKEGILCSLVV